MLHVDLRRMSSAGGIRFVLETELLQLVPALQCRSIDARTGYRAEWTTLSRESDGTFVCRGLPPGKIAMDLRAVAETGFSDPPLLLGTTIEFDVPANEVADCAVRMEIGARLRLAAKDERGGFVRAEVELRDMQGNKLRTEFFCRTPGMLFGCDWYLCEQGINDHPALPAGKYNLTLIADGYEPAQRQFELVQGETLTLEVPMRGR